MSETIKINNERYQCLIPKKKVLEVDSRHFDLRSCYEVVYLNKQTGALSVTIIGRQFSAQDAIDYAQSYISVEKFEVIDGYPIVELIEDETCLRRRLKYQYSKYAQYIKILPEYPRLVKMIATDYNKTLKRLGGPEQNPCEFYLSIGEVV